MNYDPNKAIRQALMVARRQAAYGGQQSYPGYRPVNPLTGLPEDEGVQVVGSSDARPIGGDISGGGNDPGTPGPPGAPSTGNFGRDVAGFAEAAGPALGGMAIGGLMGGPAGAVMGGVASTMAQGLAEATGLSNPASAPPGGFASVAGNIAQTQMGMQPTSNPVDAVTAAVTGPQAPADQEDADQGNAQAAADAAAAAAAAADNANSMSEAATADASADSDGGSNGDSGDAGGDGDGGGGGGFARGGDVKGGMDPRDDITSNENFNAWFGNSVAHDNGVPIRFYHGTSKDKDFTSFNMGKHGVWLTTDPEEASAYAEQNDSQGYSYASGKIEPTNIASRVIPVYLKAENPYTGDLPEQFKSDNYKKAQSTFFDQLRAAGYDSWIPEKQNGKLAVALGHPTQIKSAVGNNGNFSPKEKHIARADGGEIMPQRDLGADPSVRQALDVTAPFSVSNPMSVFPKPQRMWEDQRPGGAYLAMPTKEDITGHKAAQAEIGVSPGGKPFFNVSRDAVEETGSPGRGSATVKTNLFKQKAGWQWAQAPEGHEDTNTLVSINHRGKHHYALNAQFPKGVDLARYENAPTEPRLRPTTKGNVELGEQVGTITVRGKEHPVYRNAIVRNTGGAVGYADGGMPGDDPTVQRAMDITRQVQPSAPQIAATVQPQAKPVQYKSWADVPTINPQDLVGKRVFPILADLTKAGSAFTGIDASQVAKPEQLYGGPGYPLLLESQEKGLAWAVEGKGRGSAKIRKDADYVVVSSMMPHSHQSNASFSNALMKNMDAYVRDKRLTPEGIQQIDDMIRRPTEQKELQGLQEFPGFSHPEAENFLRGISFEQRKRISNVLASKEAQNLGAPNIDKITRETLDPEFSGVPRSHGMFLLEIPKGSEDEQLVNLKAAGLPEHPSYQYGIKGRVVGKFHYPVAPEVLFKDWFDKAHAEASQKEKSNVRRAFDLAMPVGTVTQEIADMLPRHPRDIQSGKAARLALNAFNDQWAHTDDPVTKGGIGAAEFSQALKNSDFSSTLTQYSAKDINEMKKDKNFTGYKLKDGEIYFGLKRNTDYSKEYEGFTHPELSPNETALVSVVNNEPGAKGIGGAPVVLKAIQEGATVLDCYAVPSQKHPEGFLPNFYSHFNFKELGRIPFDPQYVTQTQFDDMKHQWRKSGWDETMGMPSLVIMKWDGKDGDRSDAVRRFVSQSSESVGPRSGGRDVQGTSRSLKQGAGSAVGESGIGRQGDASPDRGPVRADRNARPADRFTRTLSELRSLSPEEARHFGLDPAEVEALRQQFLPKAFGGSTVDKALRLTAPARPMVALADLFQRQLRGRPPS